MRNYGWMFSILLALAGCMDVKAVAPDPVCGDYMINREGEACDTWDTGSLTCATLGYHDGVLGCHDDCTLDLSDCERFGSCGDAVVQSGTGEDCDSSQLDGQTCLTLGYHGGELTCGADCRFDLAGCEETGFCGDGIVQEDFEECDLDAFSEGFATCQTRGYYGGAVACMANCRVDLSNCRTHGTCGDGLIQGAAGEECDTNNLGDETCHELGFFSGALACSDCGWDTAGCVDPVDVASGTNHSCVVLDDGSAWCWGFGGDGQLGNGSFGTGDEDYHEYRPVAVLAPVGVRFTRVAAGTSHTCALDNQGRAWCWGVDYGLLGTGSPVEGGRATPQAVQMPLSTTFGEIALGFLHTCALDTAGGVWCWGFNTAGQLGQGSLNPWIVGTPTRVASLPPGVVGLDAGAFHTCAVTDEGALHCWGAGESGQLGADPATLPEQACEVFPFGATAQVPCSAVPLQVGLDVVLKARLVSAGGMLISSPGSTPTEEVVVRGHTCAVVTRDLDDPDADLVFCFGANDSGQLGDGTQVASHVPRFVRMPFNISAFDAVDVGFQHSCVIGRGVGWCWGLNLFGQLANGRNEDFTTTPTMVRKPLGVNLGAISAGFAHNCALSQGRVWCWGFGIDGQLGMGSSDIVHELTEVRLPE
jgi:alpha-tubulin suppressor-like RCC1 family protein